MRYANLTLAAQTTYAELFSQTQAFELANALGGLVGKFSKRTLKGRDYWYFGYRDIDQKLRMAYVGPDNERVQNLVHRFNENRQDKPLATVSRIATAAGNTPVAPKHFRIIRRLAEYGFFRAGGILIGTHAFLAMGNMLGVGWRDGAATLDVDFAHAGRNVSLALPADLRIDVHGALESLEMGLLPISQFNGKAGAQYRNPKDQELRLDFVTSMSCDGQPVIMEELNLTLEPLKFMEFSLENPVQACIFSNLGACVVNLPAPERYAVHKLIVHGERPVAERVKATKDILQAASLASYFLENGQADLFNDAWRDAIGRGQGWQARAEQGQQALLRIAPDLAQDALWQF
ncbi:MAG: hypothetical protein CVU34_00540 [Betaproteobacteria bacterium HGW-Betaproteobacteria-7]|jgi:hypothetical protein|nr:MAG: hypothetical protein CVU34_00540 [Betaproteobacteria bacterium HGW-Betaproteobacteria-7]